jgi:hypothetical protein
MVVSPKCRPLVGEGTLLPNSDWGQPMKTTNFTADRPALLIVDSYIDFIERRRQALRAYEGGSRSGWLL